jgi:pyruvate dehydrogenase E1 component
LEFVLEHILKGQPSDRVPEFVESLIDRLRQAKIQLPRLVSTPYVNTILEEEQPPFPGDPQLERRIKSYIRWNAMAMVINANRKHNGLGGHISTYASAATLYEIGFNHFFRGGDGPGPADLVYFQGHATPGNYARAYLLRTLNAHEVKAQCS